MPPPPEPALQVVATLIGPPPPPPPPLVPPSSPTVEQAIAVINELAASGDPAYDELVIGLLSQGYGGDAEGDAGAASA